MYNIITMSVKFIEAPFAYFGSKRKELPIYKLLGMNYLDSVSFFNFYFYFHFSLIFGFSEYYLYLEVVYHDE